MLILPVVIHDPDFFRAGAGADEVDFGFGDSVDSSAQALDDLIGKAVGDGAGRFLAGGFVVLFAEHLGIGRVAGVEEPAIDDQMSVGAGKSAESHHGGVGRSGRPLRKIDFLG